MKRGKDISVEFKHLCLIHHNVPGKKLPQTSFSSHILFLPLQGEIRVTLQGKQLRLGPGHMLYLPPDTYHSFESSEATGERLIAMVKPSIESSKKIEVLDPKVLPLSQLIKEILFYLLLHPQSSNSRSLIEVMFETLAETLQGQGISGTLVTDHLSGKIKDLRVLSVLEHVQENLADKLSIDDLAKIGGLSSRNLNRLFLLETGLTPKQFLILARMEKAQELLLNAKSSVTEVAFSVGYSSLGQFIAAFKAQTGQLPSDFLRIGRKR